jgi:hypothetical protein
MSVLLPGLVPVGPWLVLAGGVVPMPGWAGAAGGLVFGMGACCGDAGGVGAGGGGGLVCASAKPDAMRAVAAIARRIRVSLLSMYNSCGWGEKSTQSAMARA